MQGAVRQISVCRAGNIHRRKVKIVSAAGGEVELLWGSKLCRQLDYIRRNVISRFVELAIAAKPLEVAICISVRAGQAVGRRRGKLAAGFHDDLNILGAITQRAAAKVKGDDLQSVRAQCVRVQDFKDGAETEGGVGVRTNAGVPVAGRCEPTMHTDRLRALPGILPPGFHSVPVFDISAVLVQYPVPFVALGRAAG